MFHPVLQELQCKAEKLILQSKGLMPSIPPKILTHVCNSAPCPIFLSSNLQVFTKNITQTIFSKEKQTLPDWNRFSFLLFPGNKNKSIWICTHPVHFLTVQMIWTFFGAKYSPMQSALWIYFFLPPERFFLITNSCTFRLFFLLNSWPLFFPCIFSYASFLRKLWLIIV